MINIEVFLLGLMLTSTLTGLTTEAVKKLLNESNIPYRANTLVGIVALFISTIVGIAYILLNAITFDAQSILCLIALIFMSWLSSMVGYDKVIQTIGQFKNNKE